MFAVHANPRKPRTFIPSKYTRYTVLYAVNMLSASRDYKQRVP